ncbi:MAG: hypothetical protein U0414_24080 [Polyangiaceae bacterium]
MRGHIPLVALAALLALAGCADPPAIDVHLTVDPNLNTEDALLAQLDRVVLVVDSDQGLYPPGAERSSDHAQIKNADSDPALELVITAEVPSHLPFVRIERGSLPDVPLSLRAFGLGKDGGSAGAYLARGDVSGVTLGDPATEVTIPFNLRPEVRAARVDQVLPADGGVALDCRVAPVVLLFSKPMSAASLGAPGVIAISPDPGPLAVYVDTSGLVVNVVAPGLAGVGDALDYHVHVGTEATDLGGAALDQVASMSGAQAFEADVHLTCVPPPMGPALPDCLTGLNCGMTYACVDGACEPLGCDVECTLGTVCDPKRAACVDDCRGAAEVGVCLPSQTCGADGVCD